MRSISPDLIARISQAVNSALQNDLVSYAELKCIIEDNLATGTDLPSCIENVLGYLLARYFPLGYAINVDGNYVRFVAWKGNIGERIKRARHEAESCKESDRDFIFWLSLPSNV